MAKNYKYRHTEVYKGVRIDYRGDTLKDIYEKVAKRKHIIDGGYIGSDSTFTTYAYKWAEVYKKHNVSLGWYNTMLKIIDKICKNIGDKKLADLTAIELQSYLNSLSNNSNSYIKKEYQIIKQIFHRAYVDGLIKREPELELPKGKANVPGRSLTDKERSVLLEVLTDHRGEIFCKLMLYCGLRGQEAAVLMWKDVDFDRGVVIVDKALKKDGTIGPPKSSAGVREVPIPINFMPLLKERRGEPFGLVCSTLNGGMYTESNRKNLIKNIKREMNIKMGCRVVRNQLQPPFPLQDFKLHYLRHTYCTDLEKAGVPINIAKVLMGHSSIEVTAGIYTHADYQTLEIARQLINEKQQTV